MDLKKKKMYAKYNYKVKSRKHLCITYSHTFTNFFPLLKIRHLKNNSRELTAEEGWMWTGLPRPSIVQNVLPTDLKTKTAKDKDKNTKISRELSLTMSNYK